MTNARKAAAARLDEFPLMPGTAADVISKRASKRMQNLLRDFLLSYCPASVRRTSRPESTLRTLHAATWGGFAQSLLAGLVLILRLKSHFILRTHEFGPQIAGSNETGQAIIVIVFVLDYLVHPLSLFLLYLAIEGFIRFVGGLITGEVVPSLAVSLLFKAFHSFSHARDRRQSVLLPVDLLENLPEGRIRIASAGAKAGWNANITIGLNGQWFEIEREESGVPPRAFIYILRPAPPGKILRRYEEYNFASALGGTGASSERSGNAF